MKKFFKIIYYIVITAVVFIALLIIVSAFPINGNIKMFTVLSGSMEPTIHTGSLIFVKPMADYNVDDIVTKKTSDPKVTITHRLYSKEEIDGKVTFQTKGDANNAPDGEKFTKEGIIGKEIFNIPYLGYPVGYAKTTQGLILLIVVPAVIIIYDEINKIKAEIRKKLDYRRRMKKRQEGEDDEDLDSPT